MISFPLSDFGAQSVPIWRSQVVNTQQIPSPRPAFLKVSFDSACLRHRTAAGTYDGPCLCNLGRLRGWIGGSEAGCTAARVDEIWRSSYCGLAQDEKEGALHYIRPHSIPKYAFLAAKWTFKNQSRRTVPAAASFVNEEQVLMHVSSRQNGQRKDHQGQDSGYAPSYSTIPKCAETTASAPKDAKAKAAKKAALAGTNSQASRKKRTSVSFHRPKTLRLARTPKYPRKSVPHVPRMDQFRTIVSCVCVLHQRI